MEEVCIGIEFERTGTEGGKWLSRKAPPLLP